MSDLSKYIAISKYARWIDEIGRRETWEETVDRMINFWRNREIVDEGVLSELREATLNKEVMPSMRSMMSAGKALEKENLSAFNCSASGISHQAIFSEALYILLAGAGFGFSVEREYVNKLPDVAEEFYDTDTTIVVKDSKLGWAVAFKELISMLYAGQIPKIDYSKIRPAGSRLKTTGGRASGPDAFQILCKYTINLFVSAKGRKLTTIECHDLLTNIANSVIVGGVRRSALISLTNLSDERMKRAKYGQWWIEHPNRGLANISVAYTSKPDMESFLSEMKTLFQGKSGERGIWNKVAAKKVAENCGREYNGDYITNPCLTGDTLVAVADGRTIVPIEQLYIEQVPVLVYCAKRANADSLKSGKHWKTTINAAKAIYSGEKEIIKVTLSDGTSFECTENHKLALKNGQYVEAGKSLNMQMEKFSSFSGKNIKHINAISDDHIFVEKIEKCGTKKVYDLEVEHANNFYIITKTDGEEYLNCTGILVHNCGETILRDSGGLCNLSSVVIRENDTLDQLKEKVRLATIYGTMQATLTNFRFLRKIWIQNAEEERLLGVSFTGIMDHSVMSGKKGNEELILWLKTLKEEAKRVNKEYANKFKIPQSGQICCIKPEGTVSLLCNTSSGIHPRYSKYYIRRVRQDLKDPLTNMMIDQNIPNVRDGEKFIFSFYVKSPENAVLQKEISSLEQLELWKIYKIHWCDGNPSQTIYYTDNEFIEMLGWLWKNWNIISGLSFFPVLDHVYKNAPLEEITEEKYLEMIAEFPDDTIDWSKICKYEKEDNFIPELGLACSSGQCEII